MKQIKVYRKHFRFFLICLIVLAFGKLNLQAQFNIKDKIKQKTQNKTEQKTDEQIDKGLNNIEKGVEGIFNKKKKNDNTKKDSLNDTEEGEDENLKMKDDKKPNSQDNPQSQSLKSYTKYDYIPGEHIVYFEDFSDDNIGDFPDKWNTNSSGEIVTLNNYPGKWLSIKGGGTFYPEALTKFPENFTLEIDIISSFEEEPNCMEMGFISHLEEENMDGLVPGKGGFGLKLYNDHFTAFNWKDANYAGIDQRIDAPLMNKNGKVNRLAIWVQKQRFRLYYDGKKVYDIPRLIPAEVVFNRLRFFLWGCEAENASIYISNIRVAEAAPDMRSKLLTEGKLVTHGIRFDTGSDKIKPESYGTLKEIANILKDNPTIKVRIIGHTDNDGGEAFNLTLSNKRALSVKNALNTEFAIDASRLETEGKGMSEPLSPNTTTEGKANNRRVEFVKIGN